MVKPNGWRVPVIISPACLAMFYIVACYFKGITGKWSHPAWAIIWVCTIVGLLTLLAEAESYGKSV